ncbi:CAP domain-containing protein [Microvirga tunisiensis]|uniref:CAP domain-containing protein n=3 Tax=Pannonibacter tanglangensis TaxID=2750084 RepID=A0ABW9ZPR6_9HYPH|nr:CAP domain-containing protein [Pannonibacter sp. XCT-34]NBN80405.1 CAP domain-containing protein [Pannonibacter sp. XCT-53]
MLGVALATVAGCQSDKPVELPPFYRDLARVNATVDAQSALQMINQYRQNNGLRPLTLDPTLMSIAQSQARTIASADNIRASLEPQNQLKTRLDAIGETKTYAVENVSAGYRTLAEAFSGWRESQSHNRVMLDAQSTRMGIATHYAPNSKYKVFWSLVLASQPQ